MMANSVPIEMFKAFGGKDRIDIQFKIPKRVALKLNESDVEETYERVTSISIMNFITGLVSIDINYSTDKGDGSFSTGIQNYESIKVLD